MSENRKLNIDPEFKTLTPRLSSEEYAQLEANLLSEGCRDALVTWNNLIIDGHNRYEICTRHNIAYQIIEHSFDSREDVIIWIIQNQLARRNISLYTRSELALKLKAVVAAKARRNLPPLGERRISGVGPTLDPHQRTLRILAKSADVSHGTLHKVETVTKKAPEPVKEAARRGDITVNQAYEITKAIENAPETIKPTLEERFQENETPSLKAVKEIISEEKRRQRNETIEQTAEQMTDTFNIIEGDMQLLWDELADDSVDMFFTDPPYHANKVDTYETLAALAWQKLKPGGLCLAYSGQMHLPEVLASMSKHLDYWWIFAIHHTGGHLSIWNRKLWNDWKPVLVFAKPQVDVSAMEWTQDFIDGGGRDKRFHEWGQDANEATYWIERLTQPNALICDPYVGGGAIPVACKLTGRRWIGTDINPQAVMETRVRLSEVRI